MTGKRDTSLWRKAAVLGSLWAASEIVLGGFLHACHVPLRGQALTFIGIAILAGGRSLWPERGLMVRSGLVCAALKAASPGPGVLIPMLSIAAEGALMELGALPGGALGCLMGGGLAMLWNPAYGLGRALLVHGPQALGAFARAWRGLEAWLGRPMGGPWTPALAWAALNFLAGVAAAACGLRAAARAPAKRPPEPSPRPFKLPCSEAPAGEARPGAMALHLVFAPAVLVLGGRFGPWVPSAAVLAYAGGCALSYPRCRFLLGRWDYRLGLLGACVLSGLFLASPSAALRTLVRAVALTQGLAALASELSRRGARVRLGSLLGRSFLRSVDAASGVLPAALAVLPEGRELLLRPSDSLAGLLCRAPAWLDRLERAAASEPPSAAPGPRQAGLAGTRLMATPSNPPLSVVRGMRSDFSQ